MTDVGGGSRKSANPHLCKASAYVFGKGLIQTRTGSAMFLSWVAPRSLTARSSRDVTCRYASSDRQIRPSFSSCTRPTSLINRLLRG